MTQFLQQLINGLSLGSIYALIALGYTMVYGIIKLINFAHGEMYMIGAYLGFVATTVFKLPFLLALPVAMVSAALISILVERIAYKPLRKSSRVAALITAIGVSLFLQNIVMLLMGPQSRNFPAVIPNIVYEFSGIKIKFIEIVIFITSIALMLALTIIVKKTKIGRAMRACSVDVDTAKLMGVNIDNTISFTFAIGSSLAAAGGVLIAVYYNVISPYMGIAPGLKAFVSAVFGGIGIIPGAMVGGVFIGLIEVLVSAYFSTTFKDAVVYLLLIVILVIKPSGLFGKNVKEKV